MAYDEDLANRIRALIGAETDMTEKRMFGGLAFLLGGNIAVTVSGRGGLMVRVDPGQSDALVQSPDVTVVEMRGRLMPGWLRVAPEELQTDYGLATWVDLGISYARTLPAKSQDHRA